MKGKTIFNKLFKRENPVDLDRAITRVLVGDNRPVNIDEETSLAVSAVWACVRILSNTVGILPVNLYKRVKNGRIKIYDNPAVDVINRPNAYWTKFDLLQYIMTCLTLWGNAYLRINRDKYYQPESLSYIMPWEAEPVLSEHQELFYRVNGELLDSWDVIHVKGLGTNPLKGLSPIQVHRENLELSVNVQKYGQSFFTKGGNTEGVFEMPGTLSKDAHARLKHDLFENTVGLSNAHNPLILEGGMKYQRINIPLEDAQFLGSRKYQKTEVATIFGVPPHMIADLERATNNNIEHQGMEFVMYSLMPYLVKIELEFKRKLLREEDRYLYFKFNVNALLRGDAKTRSEYYKNMYLLGAMSANEIRELEDMNPYAGGEKYFVQLNMEEANKKKTDGDEDKE